MPFWLQYFSRNSHTLNPSTLMESPPIDAIRNYTNPAKGLEAASEGYFAKVSVLMNCQRQVGPNKKVNQST